MLTLSQQSPLRRFVRSGWPVVFDFSGGLDLKSIPVFSVATVDFSRVHAAEIRQELQRLAAQAGSLILDMSTVSYVDSVALTLLHSIDEMCRNAGGRLILAGVHPGVVRVFETMGLPMQLSASVEMAQADLANST
jgi:anti-anti-sigma factor